jgi:hypothetical protein
LSFVELGFENPTYAKPPSPLPTTSSDNWDLVKYDFFVTHMLWTMEEIYTLFPDDANWQDAIRSHVAPHLHYVRSGPFDPMSYKKDFLLKFVGVAAVTPPASAPATPAPAAAPTQPPRS